MNWLDRKIDDFIRYIRDTRPSIPICPGGKFAYTRWFVIPRNRWFNVYLHHFEYSDLEDLHDHRMANISVILQGEYFEERFERRPVVGQPLPRSTYRIVSRLRPLIRRPSTAHRVVLFQDENGKNNPAWSLFIGGPHVRDWGFWHQNRVTRVAEWDSHKLWVKDTDPTSEGYGRPKT
jgi:hypothetical protein